MPPVDEKLTSTSVFLDRFYERAGTTQQKYLAQLANVTTGSMSRIQSGQSMPSIETLARIALALDTTVDYLIGISDSPKGPKNGSRGAAKAKVA